VHVRVCVCVGSVDGRSEVDCREWVGVPGTGKPFNHFGFLMMRVEPEGIRRGSNSRLIWRGELLMS